VYSTLSHADRLHNALALRAGVVVPLIIEPDRRKKYIFIMTNLFVDLNQEKTSPTPISSTVQRT
jgi:hypothetical protein